MVIWAAGVGHIGASPESLSIETSGVLALRDCIRVLPAERAERLTVLFASSAGALFGGHGDAEVLESSSPRPVTAYGREKLHQEALLSDLASETGCRVVACRISNLFGLARGRLTARGLIATAVRSTRLRQPMSIYVSQDTRRDYIYNADAAAVALRLGSVQDSGFTTALVQDGVTRTVSEVLALVGRVSGRRVPATYAERPETRLQPRVLRFTRPVPGADQVRRTPMEAAIHLMLRAPLSV